MWRLIEISDSFIVTVRFDKCSVNLESRIRSITIVFSRKSTCLVVPALIYNVLYAIIYDVGTLVVQI